MTEIKALAFLLAAAASLSFGLARGECSPSGEDPAVSGAAEPRRYFSGDVNQDGAVDAADHLLLSRWLTEFPGADAFRAAADLNGDGRVDSRDVVLLGRKLSRPAAGAPVGPDPVVGSLRFVPAGTFVQGSPEDEPCRMADQTQFTHQLTLDLAVMETEVTRQMWADLRLAQGTLPEDPTVPAYGAGPANPVQGLTWYEAVLFANLLSVQNGYERCYYRNSDLTVPLDAGNYQTDFVYCKWSATGYRLPSEGEWEYFGRAGTATPFWIAEPDYTADNCGKSATPELYLQLQTAAWFLSNSRELGASSPAGGKAANPWNLKDVHGNVWEWCWDWYYGYPAGKVVDYRSLSYGTYRSARGGSWGGEALFCRSAHRHFNSPFQRSDTGGFRLVRSLP